MATCCISVPAGFWRSLGLEAGTVGFLAFITRKAIIAMSTRPPAIPPAIAAILGALGALEGGDCGWGWFVGSSGTASPTASPTANVEKWVTTKVHLHCPFCTRPLHGDKALTTEDESPALSSETANPCQPC